MDYYNSPAIRQALAKMGMTDINAPIMYEARQAMLVKKPWLVRIPKPLKYYSMDIKEPIWSYKKTVKDLYKVLQNGLPDECKFVVPNSMTILLDKEVYVTLKVLLCYCRCNDAELNQIISDLIREVLFSVPDRTRVTKDDLMLLVLRPRYDNYTYCQLCEAILECIADDSSIVRFELQLLLADHENSTELASKIISKYKIKNMNDLNALYKAKAKEARLAKFPKKKRRIKDVTTDFIVSGL